MVAEDVKGYAGQGSDNQKNGKKQQSLHPTVTREALRPAIQAGCGAQSQQQPQDGQAPERIYKAQNVADAAERDGFGQLIGRQGIRLRGRLSGGLRLSGLNLGWLASGPRARTQARSDGGEQKDEAEQEQHAARKSHRIPPR